MALSGFFIGHIFLQYMSNNANATPAPVPHVWSKDALFTKAQRYAGEMVQYAKDDWRFGLWASFTLEALSRAALANVSPVLLADTPKDSWGNLYFALGGAPKAQKFIPKSIEISLVLSRLSEVLPNLDTRLNGVCVQLIARRNEDLHSGGTPFDNIVPSAWIPLFYEACAVFLSSIGCDLEDLVGEVEADIAAQMIAAAKDESAKAIAASINAHQVIWNGKTDDERDLLKNQAALWAKKQNGHRSRCPSCSCVGLVSGAAASAPVMKLENGLIVERQEHLPSKFECVACGLKINGLSQLHMCGLGDPYTATNSYDPVEYYGSEYQGIEWEPDNND